jgi:protein O-GlcNAc transferase
MSNDAASDTVEPTLREVRYEYTPHFPEILAHLRASILVTTYQAGKLLVLGVADGKLQISFLSYEQPMGLAVSDKRIAIGTRRQIHFLVPAHET